MIKEFWQALSGAAKVTLAAGVVMIVGATLAFGIWLLRTDYETLFSGLAPQDAAALTAELDRMKQPYVLGSDGTSILVDKHQLHQTRLKLMSKDIPLHGAVGFELFNNSDFGMTEFAQKVNFQRALQGELTRTILSLSEVESVRVHLAFPEEGLFKREQVKAKASISLALKHGQSLRPEQVTGIQRLVAAAVAGVAAQDVTIVNQQGVALTRVVTNDVQQDMPLQLELKKDIEQLLARKVSQVLDRSFGAGRALASVDVTLDMNQVRTTTEDVTGPVTKSGDTRTGVLVHERETLRDDAAPLTGRDAAGGTTHRETDYQVGRRVEQVVSQPGSIQQIQVVAVVKAPLDAHQIEQLKALIGAAAGTQSDRGDTVVVQSLDSLGNVRSETGAEPMASSPPSSASQAAASTGGATEHSTASPPSPSVPTAVAVLAGMLGAVVLALLAWWANGLARGRGVAGNAPPMSPEQREAALSQIRQWVAQSSPKGNER